MTDYQSQYTGAQLDAAIAKYVNRRTGQIILTPDQLTGGLSDGYYSGISASLNYSVLTAEAANVLSGKTFIGKNGSGTGAFVPASAQTGTVRRDSSSQITISDLSGTPSNVVLLNNGYKSSSQYALYVSYIDGEFVISYRTSSGIVHGDSGSVTFDHVNGTCTVKKTITSGDFESGRDYIYVVW